jgi:hypothetical protein
MKPSFASYSFRASSKFFFHRSQFLVSVSLVDNEVCLFASLFEFFFFSLQFCLCVFSCPLWSVLCFCTCCNGSIGYVLWAVNPFWTYFWRYFCVCMRVYLHDWLAYFLLKPLSKAIGSCTGEFASCALFRSRNGLADVPILGFYSTFGFCGENLLASPIPSGHHVHCLLPCHMSLHALPWIDRILISQFMGCP